jgi:hypothetical protein
MDRVDLPLRVGEMVTYNNYVAAFGVSGLIVECLGNEVVRVKWGDLLAPTTHRNHSLRRVVDLD